MTLVDQAVRRVALARELQREPVRWIATAQVAAELPDANGRLAGLPVDVGAPRSEWGLQLVTEAAA